jgi:hypothetical protein
MLRLRGLFGSDRVICLRDRQVGKQYPVMRPDDVLIEQPEQGSGELAVAVSLEMFQREGAGDNLAPGIGFTFSLFVAGFESFQLGIDLVTFLAEEFEPVGGGSAWHCSSSWDVIFPPSSHAWQVSAILGS